MKIPALIVLLLGTIRADNTAAALDSLRHRVASLSARGQFDSAVTLVQDAAPSLPAPWESLLEGKLELRGSDARHSFEAAFRDSLHDAAPRGESIFRLGQFYYATGKYPFAIPRFRQYLALYPKGPWRDPAAYWMAYACLQFVQGAPGKRAYLDTGLRYLNLLRSQNGARGYYFPLALTARARLLLARGHRDDTASALAALQEARRRTPPEEFAATLLLSGQAASHANGDDARIWEDSVLWEFPASLEASFIIGGIPDAKTPPVRADSIPARHPVVFRPQPRHTLSQQYSLQLGAFSAVHQAEKIRKTLAEKGIRVWIEKSSRKTRMFSVLHGIYPDSQSAFRDGRRLFTPLSLSFRIIPLRP